MVAGITIPTFILVGLAAVPYVDRNPSTKPGDRKIAITLFTMLFMFGAIAHDHRLVLPRPRLQLGLAVGAGGVLRAVTVTLLAISTPLVAAIVASRACSTSSPSCSGSRSSARNRQPRADDRRTRQIERRRRKPVEVASPGATSSAGRCSSSLVVFGAQFGGATIAFLWPNLKGGFGSLIDAGNVADIKAEIDGLGRAVYNGTGRFYIVPLRRHADAATSTTRPRASPPRASCRCTSGACTWDAGCRSAAQSKWFECPCHGSKYNGAGEYQLGPAPRGMDRFQIDGRRSGNVLVDTSEVILGPPRGTDTIDQPPQGAVLRGAGIGEADEHAHARLSTSAAGIVLAGRSARSSSWPPAAALLLRSRHARARPRHPPRHAPGPVRRRARDAAAAEAAGLGRRAASRFFVVWIPCDWLREPSDEPRPGARAR